MTGDEYRAWLFNITMVQMARLAQWFMMIYLSMLNYQRDLESNEYIPLVSNIYCFSTMLESWIMLPGHDCWRMAVKNRKQRYTWIDHDLTVMPERCWMDSGHHPQMADNSYFQFSGWWITLFGQNIYIYTYIHIYVYTLYIYITMIYPSWCNIQSAETSRGQRQGHWLDIFRKEPSISHWELAFSITLFKPFEYCIRWLLKITFPTIEDMAPSGMG